MGGMSPSIQIKSGSGKPTKYYEQEKNKLEASARFSDLVSVKQTDLIPQWFY